jgi:hypothetical protein
MEWPTRQQSVQSAYSQAGNPSLSARLPSKFHPAKGIAKHRAGHHMIPFVEAWSSLRSVNFHIRPL